MLHEVAAAGECCRIHEVLYDGGAFTCETIVVSSNGTYVARSFSNSHLLLLTWRTLKHTTVGQLDAEEVALLQRSTRFDSHWETVSGTPTFYVELDDSKSRHPDPVLQAIRQVRIAQSRTSVQGAAARQ